MNLEADRPNSKQPRPQIRRSRRNSEANKNDDNSENGLEEDGEPRRKTKPPSKWALRMQSERERKKAAEEARAEVARKDAQARQQTAIDSSRGTLKICQTSYSPAPAAGTNSHDHDGVIAPSIDTAIAPSSSHTSVTPASSNILTLTSSHTSQTSHSGRILFEPVTEHDPKNQPVSEDDQPTLRSNYLKEIQEIRKKTRNTFKLEDEAVSRQWTGNKGRAGKLNAMYHRLASTYQSAPGNPSPYELAEQELAQKRAGAEGAAADSQQSPTASRPATAPRPAQRGSSKREKKQDRDQQPQEEPPSVEPDATTVAPRAVMRAPAAHSRAEDGLRSSRQEQRQKQKGRGSKKRAEQLAAEAAIAKARADLLAAEARAAAFESTDDSPERTEAVAAQRQTNPPCGGYDSQRHSQYAYSESFRPHRPMHENEDHQAFPPHRALRHGTHDPYLPNYNSGYAGSSPYLSPYEGHGYHHNPGYRCGSTHGYDQNLNAHQTHPGLTREHSFPPEALPHPGQRSVYPDPIYAGAGAYVYGTYGMQHDMRRSASSNPAVHPIVGRQGRTAPSINRQGLRDQPGHSTNVGTHGEQSASLHDREADLPITLAPTSNRIGSHRNTNGGDLPSSHGEHFASTSRLHVGLRGDLQASFRTSMAGPQLPGPSQGPQSHTHTHNDDDHSESQAEQHQQTTAGQLEVPDAVPSTTRIDDAEGSEVSDNEFHRSSTALMAPERYSTASRYPDGSTTYDATRARLSSVRSSTPARTPAGGTPAPVAGTASSSTITAKNTHKSRSPEKGRNNRKGKSPHKRTSNDNDTANLDDQYDDSTSSRCKRPATSPASAANTNATMQETLASHRTSRASVRRIMYAEGSSDVESEGENNDAAADDGGGGVIGGGGIRGDGQQRRGAGVGSRSGKGEEVIVDRDAMEIEREDGH